MFTVNYYFHSSLKSKEKAEAQQYLEKKLPAWEKFFINSDFPPKIGFEADFLVRKKSYRVELKLESMLGKMIGEATAKTLMEGIDEIVADVRRQIGREKDKLQTLRRRGCLSLKKRFCIHKGARFRKPR